MSRPRHARLTACAVAAAALALGAPAANADLREIDEDGVKITSVGFDFRDGDVRWLVDENNLTPQLTGELHRGEEAIVVVASERLVRSEQGVDNGAVDQRPEQELREVWDVGHG